MAVGCVVTAATLGQLLAGDDPRSRLAELDTTRLTLPFAAWIVIAVLYYVISGVVVYRLGRRLPEAKAAFGAVLCVMLANEAWNVLLPYVVWVLIYDVPWIIAVWWNSDS